MNNKPTTSFKFNSFVLLAALPILLLGLFIAHNRVNVPIADQWEIVPMIEHLRAGHFVLSDFWWQHNEHRVFIPNLILTLSAMLTHWDTIVEIILSFLVSIASFALVMKMMLTALRRMNRKLFWWLPLTLSIIWFSPVQVENWLWGWQLEWFLNVLGAVVVAYALTKIRSKNISWAGLVLIIAGALLAQFSLGNGTLIWPLAVAALVYCRVPIPKSAIVAATGALTTALYYRHYLFPEYPSRRLFIHEPVGYIKYVLTYLGRPLTFLHPGAAVMGACVLAIFVSLNVYLFIRKRETFNKLIPWTILGLYAVTSAAITGVSRLGFGLDQAYSSRYTTISMLLLVSLIVSLCLAAHDLPKLPNLTSRKLVVAGLLAILTALLITNAMWGVRRAAEHRTELIAVKTCTSSPNPTDGCMVSAYPYLPIIKDRLYYIKQIHWGGY